MKLEGVCHGTLFDAAVCLGELDLNQGLIPLTILPEVETRLR
jgi:hypothetical protein